MKLFKKLALVLSAVMVITLIPAKATYAAKEARLAFQEAKSSSQCITEFELKLGKSQDLKFYGVGDYKTTGIGWESSNDAVATVDKNGVVTAKGVGSAAIIYKAKGYTSIPATVVVTTDDYNVYLAEQLTGIKYTAYNLQPGKQVDFKFIGASGWTVTRYAGTWASTDETVAVVDKNGLVTARKEGQCQIVLTLVDKKTGKVAFNVKPCTVTVGSTAVATATPKPSASATPTPQLTTAFAVKQTAYNEAEITFKNANIKASEINLAVADGANYITTKSDLKDGKMTVKFSLDFQDGKEYTITNGNDKYTFKASNGAASSIRITYSCNDVEGAAYEYEEVKVKAACYDANGVLVKGTPTLSVKDDFGESEIYDGIIYMGAAGDRSTVTAKLTANGKTLTSSAVITARTVPPYNFVSAEARIVDPGKTFSDGKAGNLTVPYGDDVKCIAFKLTDNLGKVNEFVAGTAAEPKDGYFMLTSSNPAVLEVDDDGNIYTNNQGAASVKLVYFNTERETQTTLGTFNITVQAPSYIANATAKIVGPQKNVISSIGAGFDSLDIVYTIVDQYNNVILPELADCDYTVKCGSGEVDWLYGTWERDETEKTLTLKLKYAGGMESEDVAYKSVTVEPSFMYNYDYNEKEFKRPTTSIKIVNFSKTHNATYVVVKDPNSATSLGALAGSGELTVGASIVEQYQGAYGNPLSTGFTKWDSTKKLEDLAEGYYYDVSISGSGDAYNAIKNDKDAVITATESGVTVKVRDAVSGADEDAIATALRKQGSMTVKISFYQVVKGTNGKNSKKTIGTTQSFSINASTTSVSTATVTFGGNMTADYIPSSDSDWESWLEKHAVITIHNGATEKDIVIAKEGDFAKYGVKAVVKWTTRTSSVNGYDYANISRITFYVETKKGNEGWLSIAATLQNNNTIYSEY